jgi:hypothetical protein
MIARIGYGFLAVCLVTLAATFGVRVYEQRRQPLPGVLELPDFAGISCEDGLAKARELTKATQVDRARLAYLWLRTHCASSPLLPDVLLEAGSLCGHLMQRPVEAQQIYQEFLSRFPTHPAADDATYHLAKLEIDGGDYAAAVAHLTALAQRYPDSPHQESAKFLASKAAEMLAADRTTFRSVSGQLGAFVPNNPFSLFALLLAVGPAALEVISKAKRERRWLIPTLVLVLTLLNYLVNNWEAFQRNAQLMETFVHLAAAEQQAPAAAQPITGEKR